MAYTTALCFAGRRQQGYLMFVAPALLTDAGGQMMQASIADKEQRA
jgi:hypothetical protein